MNNFITTKESAYNSIAQLVERFEEQFDSYKRAEYNETLTRIDFVDPFFKALGWDVDNSLNHAESYREVIHEDRVKVGKATKAPDYSFAYSSNFGTLIQLSLAGMRGIISPKLVVNYIGAKRRSFPSKFLKS